MEKNKPRESFFTPNFLEDLRFWVETDQRIALKVLDLVDAILRDPFSGIGKPEPLKHLGSGVWSRRINQEHRLLYRVHHDRIAYLQARHRY